MAVDVWKPGMNRGKPRERDRLEFRLIFMATFALFLAVALIERLSPFYWWNAGRGAPRKSVLREAKDAANNSVPYAFMG